MQRIVSDSAKKEAEEIEIRTNYIKIKSEYDKEKAEYELELKEEMALLEEKRAFAQKESENVNEDLLNRYNSIKQHVYPPVAILLGDQCSGCNMSLPQAILRTMKNDTKLIECETCGRMLITQED